MAVKIYRKSLAPSDREIMEALLDRASSPSAANKAKVDALKAAKDAAKGQGG